MKFVQKTIGFTLIELLVVITIIGILATGGVVTYTSQIQKARDTTRINDVKAIQSGLEQYYQDKSEYPQATFSWTLSLGALGDIKDITTYVPKIPKDPKTGQPCNKGDLVSSGCDYAYAVANDSNGLLRGEYKVSTAFENKWNIDSKAKTDGGSPQETNRLELGLNISSTNKNTECLRTAVVTVSTGVATAAQCWANATTIPFLIIAGN